MFEGKEVITKKKKEAAKRKDKETDENCELVIGHVYSYLEV